MKGKEFIFDSVILLHYHLQKKKAAINPKNNDDNCFQYAIIAALNHEQIKNHPERISNLQAVIDQYNWKGINFPQHKSNSKSIALNILFVLYNAEKIRLAYKSKHNFKRKN